MIMQEDRSRRSFQSVCLEVPNMRILHCIASLGGGGTERQLSYLSEELAKNGADVHIAYHLGGPNLGRIQGTGATLHSLRILNNHDPMLLLQLIKTIRKVRPDLIQTWLPQMDIVGGIAAILTGTPFILCERASGPAYSGTWKDKLRTWIGRRAFLIIANSEMGRKYWISRKDPERIKVVPNGVPLEEIERSPKAPPEEGGIDTTAEVVLFAGRFSREKNVLTLLEALRQVFTDRPNAVALLFGQGPLERELLQVVKQYGLEERVRIHGYTEQLWGWMKRANLFVNVSVFEGSPNVVCEAAALRCPLVLSDITEHRELLGGTSAVFVSPRSPSDIARGILDVLRDSEAAKRRTEFAYEGISRLSVEAVAPEYIDLYRLALSQS